MVKYCDLVVYMTAQLADDSNTTASGTLSQRFSADTINNLGIIHKICRIYRKDPDDREDLFQEILYNAWRSYASFEGRSKFSTWLYRVALNTAFHQTRKDKFFGKLTELDKIEHYPAPEPEEDKSHALWWAIGKLDELEKSIVLLYLDELSYKEISEITGLTENNVGVKLNRIKIKMKKLLEQYGA